MSSSNRLWNLHTELAVMAKKKTSEKRDYREGDWFIVPLENEVFAAARITRVSRAGIIFAYFFAGLYKNLPTEENLMGLSPLDSILDGRVSDLSLIEGKWPVIVASHAWDRTPWPFPNFGKRDLISNEPWVVEYDDDDPSRFLSEWRATSEDIAKLPADGLMGVQFVEEKLRLLFKLGNGELPVQRR
jgi:hypothetical protein